MELRKFTKKVATISIGYIDTIDGKPAAHIVTTVHRPNGTTEDVLHVLLVGDTLDISTGAEVPAPDGGRSLVKAAWVALLDLLGYKEVTP